jgi:CheY-like chemotaxis protein
MRSSEENMNHQPAETLRGLCVLAVDDDPFSLELFAAILQPHGVEVLTCAAVAEAIECLAVRTPDVLVADIAMPGEDGYSLIKRLRSREAADGGVVPAIAVSGYAREQDRRRALAAGFQTYLTKPIEPEELIAVIAALALGRGAGHTPDG